MAASAQKMKSLGQDSLRCEQGKAESPKFGPASMVPMVPSVQKGENGAGIDQHFSGHVFA